MDDYNKQFNNAIYKVLSAISNGNNIIICGPKYSGKTYIQNAVAKLLKQKNYVIYNDLYGYTSYNKFHGKTYNDDKFWIEETNNNILSNLDLLNNYEYIETNIKYPITNN